jgi:hypothetical protein
VCDVASEALEQSAVTAIDDLLGVDADAERFGDRLGVVGCALHKTVHHEL